MSRLAHEMKRNSDDPKKVTRTKVWVAGHTYSDGRPVNEAHAETIEKIKTIDSEIDSNSSDNIGEDAVSQVLGKERPGRVRGMGRGATITKMAYLQAKDKHVQKLEATQAELITKLEKLQNVVIDLAGKKTHKDDVSSSERSDGSKRGIRCQILDWISTDDVVVGEGEYYSSEPTYKIGRIPLGPNAAAVIVNSVAVEDACVWRPTTSIGTLAEAVGVKIAWPSDKLILDDVIDFSKHANTVGSETMDASVGRVQIFDYWNVEDELIAEGVLVSTEPNQLVNDIPLGPNAAVIKVEVVVKDSAFLWRPAPGMSNMGDALHQIIAWPIDRARLSDTTAESTKKPNVSTSNSTGSSNKVGRQKCALLDCHNSGQTVAWGRVFSTDPADKVHFIPLGPNASKVMVEVSKMDDARVWRPNSEIEVIGDAVGSTVAWPTDKAFRICQLRSQNIQTLSYEERIELWNLENE
ncbi:unnamed protein product [Brassica rapa subsp. trilocularis]